MKSLFHRILIAFACVAACAPLRAVPLSQFNTFCSSDYRYGGVGGLLRLGTGTITITGAPTTPNAIGKAYLYWLGFPSPGNAAALATGTLNGQPVTGVDIGTSGDNGWATLPDLGGCIVLGLDCESHAYRADVTALLNANPSPNGAFPITLSPNVAGASLLIVFQDGDPTNDRDLIIMDGNDSNSLNSYDADGWTLQLSGFTYLTGPANLQLHVEDGQPYADADVLLNGSPLAVGPNIFSGNSVNASSNFSLFAGLGIPSAAYTRLWDIKNFNLVPFLNLVDNRPATG